MNVIQGSRLMQRLASGKSCASESIAFLRSAKVVLRVLQSLRGFVYLVKALF
ncbi:hypothetical protein [Leptolyngbya ohadii]|uniref:hypothetical protein n=1 Tax=Leptolyngbya ohadii TaxID=1962290 RepID=UPI0019D48202|nr:hypothetical protein [Leptolyngbya ohadii]